MPAKKKEKPFIPRGIVPRRAPLPDEILENQSPTAEYHQKWKRENWERCPKKFWIFKPTSRYQFKAVHWKAMMKMISTEDRLEIRAMMEMGKNHRQIAETLDLPYDVISKGFKPKKIRVAFAHLRSDRHKLSDIERMKRLSTALITEMEERVGKDVHRHEMSSQELVSMNKMLQQTVRDAEMGESGAGEGLGLTVVTKMPEKKYGGNPPFKEQAEVIDKRLNKDKKKPVLKGSFITGEQR